MSRSGYTDDCDDQWAHIRWRGAVKAAINGQRGQEFLRELAAAMDAMPMKELVANEFHAEGQFCTLGVVGAARGIDLSKFDPEDFDVRADVARALGIAEAMAAEIMATNDQDFYWRSETPQQRWVRMREWVRRNINEAAHSTGVKEGGQC